MSDVLLNILLLSGIALVLAGIGCAVALTVSTIRNRDRALRLFEEIEKSKARRGGDLERGESR